MAPDEITQQDAAVEEAKATTKATEAVADQPKADAETAEENTDWKSHARKHERLAKRSHKEVEELQAELAKLREGQQTEQEKALEQARKEAAEQTRSELVGELRRERLASAVAKQAAGKFQDVDDALRLLDADESALFDEEGKVDSDALGSALADLLEAKPHLAASPAGKRPVGDPDAGKGEGAAKSLEEMSVEDHLNAIKRN